MEEGIQMCVQPRLGAEPCCDALFETEYFKENSLVYSSNIPIGNHPDAGVNATHL